MSAFSPWLWNANERGLSRLFPPLPLFLYPHLLSLSLVHPSFSPPRSPSLGGVGGRKSSGSIADPMVWPMLYLSGQAMILSALNVIYSKRLPKSTQRDPLTQRSSLSHSHPSLALSLSFSTSNARSHAYTHMDRYALLRTGTRPQPPPFPSSTRDWKKEISYHCPHNEFDNSTHTQMPHTRTQARARRREETSPGGAPVCYFHN